MNLLSELCAICLIAPAEIGDLCEPCCEQAAEGKREWAENIFRRDQQEPVNALVRSGT